MLLLLPPSEGKSRPGSRRAAADLGALSWPELTAARQEVLDALAEASARADALELLGVGASLAGEVVANRSLRHAPSAPAGEVYSGVLFEALDLAGLSPRGRRRAARRVVVVSALWGAVRPADRIPAYRLSMGTSLPGIGALASFWRSQLDGPLTAAAGDGLVVDCRSSTYQAAWTPSAPLAARTAAVRVLREDEGRRSVVSHMAKQTRGRVARHLLERTGADPRTPRALWRAVGEAFECELTDRSREGRASVLDVVVRE